MKILAQKPHTLHGRDAPNASPIECDCSEHFLWERRRGDRVKCPTCGKEETLNFSGAPPAAMTKTEKEGAEADPAAVARDVAAAQAPPPGHD